MVREPEHPIIEAKDVKPSHDWLKVVSFRTKDYGSGSKTVLLEVYMQDGTYDKTDLRLRFE